MSPSCWEQVVWHHHLDFEHGQEIWVQVKLLVEVSPTLTQTKVWVRPEAQVSVSRYLQFELYHCQDLEEDEQKHLVVV